MLRLVVSLLMGLVFLLVTELGASVATTVSNFAITVTSVLRGSSFASLDWAAGASLSPLRVFLFEGGALKMTCAGRYDRHK